MESDFNTNIPCFEIKDCALIAIATGKRAQNLRELKEYISSISPDSIYYHFWGSLLRSHFDDPEYHNDFAIWAAHSLHDKILAERLAVIDPNEFKMLEDLRHELIEIIEERLDEIDYPFWSSKDSQFEFIRSQIVIFNTQRKVYNPLDFVEVIPKMSVGTIFYHFIDSRRRLTTSIDDFHNWLINFGEEYLDLRQQLCEIDPYFSPLLKLRTELATVFSNFFKGRER